MRKHEQKWQLLAQPAQMHFQGDHTQRALFRTGEGNKCQSSRGRYRNNQTTVVNKHDIRGGMCTAVREEFHKYADAYRV